MARTPTSQTRLAQRSRNLAVLNRSTMSSMASGTAICLILSCALVGGYASMFMSYHHGFFDALRVCTSDISGLSPEPCVLDMSGSPPSVRKGFTGIASVDSLINLLLEFFAQGLRSHPDATGLNLEALLAFGYLATQFGGAWYLISLEGLRIGNQGTILSWYVLPKHGRNTSKSF